MEIRKGMAGNAAPKVGMVCCQTREEPKVIFCGHVNVLRLPTTDCSITRVRNDAPHIRLALSVESVRSAQTLNSMAVRQQWGSAGAFLGKSGVPSTRTKHWKHYG